MGPNKLVMYFMHWARGFLYNKLNMQIVCHILYLLLISSRTTLNSTNKKKKKYISPLALIFSSHTLRFIYVGRLIGVINKH